MKKLTAVLLIALALTLCLTGCGGEKKQNESGNGAGGTAKYSFTLAHHHAVDSITDHLCTNFAKLVSEKTNGAVEITTFASGQLGTEQEVADGLLAGTQQFGTVTLLSATWIVWMALASIRSPLFSPAGMRSTTCSMKRPNLWAVR